MMDTAQVKGQAVKKGPAVVPPVSIRFLDPKTVSQQRQLHLDQNTSADGSGPGLQTDSGTGEAQHVLTPRRHVSSRGKKAVRQAPVTAKELFNRIRGMAALPAMQLPEKWSPGSIWDVLQAQQWQQRVKTWGNSALAPALTLGQTAGVAYATTQGPAMHTAAVSPPADQLLSCSSVLDVSSRGPAIQGADVMHAPSSADMIAQKLVQMLPERYTSSEPLSVVEGVEFSAIAAGKSHAAACSTHPDGHVYIWGCNQWGQLGLGQHTAASLRGQQAAEFAGSTTRPTQPAVHPAVQWIASHLVSEWHDPKAEPSLQQLVPDLPTSLLGALDAATEAAEHDRWRQLGNKRMLSMDSRKQKPAVSGSSQGRSTAGQQEPVESLAVLHVYRHSFGAPVLHVACGTAHTLVCLKGGSVWGWGSNTNGQVGIPTDTAVIPAPLHINQLAHVAKVAAGGAHSAATTTHGDVWTWGDSSWGQCGTGASMFSSPPMRVTGLAGKSIAQVACGTAHTLALTQQGEVYACGANWCHQLGLQDSNERLWPVQLPHLPACSQLAASNISLAISTAGRLYIWGWDVLLNPQGQSAAGTAHLAHHDLWMCDEQQGQQRETVGGDQSQCTGSFHAAAAPTVLPPALEPHDESLGHLEGFSCDRAMQQLAATVPANAAETNQMLLDIGIQHNRPREESPTPLQGTLPAASTNTDAEVLSTNGAVLDMQVAAASMEAAAGVEHVSADTTAPQLKNLPQEDENSMSANTAQQVTQSESNVTKESWAAAPRARGPKTTVRGRKAPTNAMHMTTCTPAPPAPPHAPPPPPPPPPPPAPPHAPPPPPPPPPPPLPPDRMLRLHGSTPSGKPPLPPSVQGPPCPSGASVASVCSVSSSAVAAAAMLGAATQPVVREVSWLQSQPVRAVACSTQYVVVVTEEGVIYTWGKPESLMGHTKSHPRAFKLHPPSGPAGYLSASALQQLQHLQGPSTGATGHRGPAAAYTHTNARLPGSKETSTNESICCELFAAEAHPSLQPEACMTQLGALASPAGQESSMPAGIGGAPLSILCAPGSHAAVWVLCDGPDTPMQEEDVLLCSVQKAAASDTVKLVIQVFNEHLNATINVVKHDGALRGGSSATGPGKLGKTAGEAPAAASSNHASAILEPTMHQLMVSAEVEFPELLPAQAGPACQVDAEITRNGRGLLQPLDRTGLWPRQEQVCMLAAGDNHTLCLCGATRRCSTLEELRVASLHLIHMISAVWLRGRQHGRRGSSEPKLVSSGTTRQNSTGATAEAAQAVVSGTSGAAGTVLKGEIRAALHQALLPEPWCTQVEDTSVITLDFVVVFCKLVGLLDNATDFQDVATCFSAAIKQHADVQAVAMGRSKTMQHTRLLDLVRSEEADWQELQAQLDLEHQGNIEQAAVQKGLQLVRSSKTPSPEPTTDLLSKDMDQTQLENNSGSFSRVLRVVDASEETDTGVHTKNSFQNRNGGQNKTLTHSEFLGLLLLLVSKRHPHYAHHPALLLRLLCKRHMAKLRHTTTDALPWINTQALHPSLQMMVDCGPLSELLHQVYVYMTNCVAANNSLSARERSPRQSNKSKGVAADLLLPLHDARQGLRPPFSPRSVPLSLVCQFLRQAGLLPKLLSKLLTELVQETEEAYRPIPLTEQYPWWWPRMRPPAALPTGQGEFRKEPTSLEPLSRAVLMAVLNDFDLLGMYEIPRTRRAFCSTMTSELYLQLAAKKRERLLAYVLVGLLGPSFASLTHPSQLQPSQFLLMPVSYPQFVEAVCSCVVLKCATQEPSGRLTHEVHLSWPRQMLAAALSDMHEGVRLWRDKLLNPWRYKRIVFSDGELERMVDKAFSLYCTIDPLADRIGVSAPSLIKIVSDSQLMDSYLTVERLSRIFLAAESLPDEAAANFGGTEPSPAKASALACLPSTAIQSSNWSGLTITQLARLKQSPLALDVVQQSFNQQDHGRGAQDTACMGLTRPPSHISASRPAGVILSLPAADQHCSPAHGPLRTASAVEADPWAAWDMHVAALDARPKAGELLPSDLENDSEPEDSCTRKAASQHAPVSSAAPAARVDYSIVATEAAHALLDVLSGRGERAVSPALAGAAAATSAVAERVASPERARKSRVHSLQDVQSILEEHYAAMQKHFGAEGTADLTSGEDIEAATNKAQIDWQQTLRGVELEQGMLGGALQRWASFDSQGFACSAATSRASSPSRSLSRSRSHSPSRGTTPNCPTPTRFLDPARLSQRELSHASQGEGIGCTPEQSDNTPCPADPSDHRARQDAASAVEMVRRQLSSGASVHFQQEPGGICSAGAAAPSIPAGLLPVSEETVVSSLDYQGNVWPPEVPSQQDQNAHPAQQHVECAADGKGHMQSGSQAEPRPGSQSHQRAASPPKPNSAVNRLVTTRKDLGAADLEDERRASKKRAVPTAAQLAQLVLSRAQFGEALRRIAVAKYAKISSPTAAWRILIERHILPLAEACSTKFDAYLQQLMSPTLISTILAWEPQLKQVFHVYARDGDMPHAQGQHTLEHHTSTHIGTPLQTGDLDMSLVQFLQLCQDRELVGPNGLAPNDLEQVFRRVHFLDGDYITGRQGMAYPQFVDAACMTGMMLLSDPRCTRLLPLVAALPVQAPMEVRLSAFLTHLCKLKVPPFAVQQALQGASAAAWPEEATSIEDMCKDPYQEWWVLGSKATPGAAHPLSHLSTQHYQLVMLQSMFRQASWACKDSQVSCSNQLKAFNELVVPPAPCPAAVAPLLDTALAQHNAGQYIEALASYAEARAAWRGAGIDPMKGHAVGLNAHQKIYFGLATASVHISAGRAQLAMSIYESLASELSKLADNHPNQATICSAKAYALYVLGDLQAAYQLWVQAKVLREQAPGVGVGHVDTALATHNLGCCLERMGHTHKALQLVASAEKLLREVLGPDHPRALVAARNLAHLQHQGCSQVELRYHVPPPSKTRVIDSGIPFSKTRRVRAKSPPTAKAITAATSTNAGSNTVHTPPPALTPAQRLAAFQLRTSSKDPAELRHPPVGHKTRKGRAAAKKASKPFKRYKKPTDLDYLGGGMFQATPDMMSLWSHMRPLVEAHATGNTIISKLPDDVVAISMTSAPATAGANKPRTAPAAAEAPTPDNSNKELQPNTTPPVLLAALAAACESAQSGAGGAMPSQGVVRATLSDGGALQSGLPAGAGLPRVALRGTVTDNSVMARKLDARAAQQVYAAALRAGVKLPELGVQARPQAPGGGRSTARKRADLVPAVRDRLGDLLSPPAPKPPGNGLPRLAALYSGAGTGVSPGRRAGGQRTANRDAADDDDSDGEEGDEDEDQDNADMDDE